MEFKDSRSYVISRSMRFNGLFQPLQPNLKHDSFLSKNSSKLDQEKLKVFGRQNQPKKLNSESNSGFRVIPTKELCRVYLHKPDLLASKDMIDALAKPPHRQKIYGEVANYSKFGRRYDQKNLELKVRRNQTSVDPQKDKIEKKENSVRSFSPLGFGCDSQLRDKKNGQYFFLEKKSKEMKKPCDGTTLNQKKDRDVRELKEVGSKLKVSTSRKSVLSMEQNRVAADVKFRLKSSSGFISKDVKDSLDSSGASPRSQTNSEDAHQPSPVSVLEPMFHEDMSENDEELPHLDFQCLEKQLDTLKSESEIYSEGNGMEVSSDEESVIDSEAEESKEREPFGFLDLQESRDSSYIDDILAEVVLREKNWAPEKLDLVITPKIFEKLEKNYYTETSWKRSERKILFDRVNSGLIEILESFKATPTWKKPVTRRLGTMITTCGLKQELWKVLARQEKRTKKKSLAKVPVVDIDDWLKLEADDESLVCELESMIVDELLSEIVSFM